MRKYHSNHPNLQARVIVEVGSVSRSLDHTLSDDKVTERFVLQSLECVVLDQWVEYIQYLRLRHRLLEGLGQTCTVGCTTQ